MPLEKPAKRTDTRLIFVLAVIAIVSIQAASASVGGSKRQLKTPGIRNLCPDGSPSPTYKVALVRPSFTLAAYLHSTLQDHSFYDFYAKYANSSGKITTDLGWLSSMSVPRLSSGALTDLEGFLSTINSTSAWYCSRGIGLYLVSDLDIHRGALFRGGFRAYDAAVLGHEEYVTEEEYAQLRQFVATGGRLVLTSADSLEVEVDYSSEGAVMRYVVGHGYQYNGTVALRSNSRPFALNSTGWLASTYRPGVLYVTAKQFPREGPSSFVSGRWGRGAVINRSNPIGNSLFHHIGPRFFKTYLPHEENVVTNMTGTSIVAAFASDSGMLVASYVHWYSKGSVVCLCIFGEEMVDDPEFKYFVFLALTADLSMNH